MQFLKSFSFSRRRALWSAALMLLCLAALVWGGYLAVEALNRSAEFHPVLRAALFVPLFIWLFAFVWLLDAVARDPILNCPACRRPLHSGRVPTIAIVTRRCLDCAAALFAEDGTVAQSIAEQPPTAPRITRAELKAAERRLQRAAVVPVLKWIVSGGLLCAAGIASGPFVSRLLAPELGETWLPFIRPVLLIPGLVVGFWSLAIWSRNAHASQALCPHCHAGLNAYASITGNCTVCGQPAVSDPYPGMEALPELLPDSIPRWTISEFHTRAKCRRNRLWIGCVLGGGLSFACLALVWKSIPSGNPGFSTSAATAFIVYYCGIGLIQVLTVIAWQHFSARGLRCPECQGELLELSRLAISSHRCYHCGCRLFNDCESISI